ncbi:MAG: UbiH/UbiF/VisC/COQ6 family ubiquinone biosynthesis hydroxylase [Gammaproteobacteria bacterium]|nr:UbiH/UbiF/VisC/COQ6 family ubiquinone biosynthesis hydroxylase [Gammaproteobacteria bacterium]
MKFDVVINGGGMVGLALAVQMPKQLSIAIIDPLPTADFSTRQSFDCRVSAISRRSQKILQQCNVWSEIPQERITAYHSMNVWDANGSAELHFTAQEVAEPNLGYIIENGLIRQYLLREVEQRTNIDFITDSLISFDSDELKCRIQLTSGQQLVSKVLIAADGATSKVREMAEIPIDKVDYQQSALVATIRTEQSHQFTAWQRFLPSGPMAYLPLPDEHLCSIVWSLDTEKVDAMELNNGEFMNARIASALDHRLGNIRLESKLFRFPLIARHAKNYIKDRVILVGDAAHSIHPLAGQGVNLGFADAATLAKVISKAVDSGLDFAKRSHLRAYERERKGENHLTEKAMTALNWTYSQNNPALVLARNFGVNMVDKFTSIKRQFMHKALGLN